MNEMKKYKTKIHVISYTNAHSVHLLTHYHFSMHEISLCTLCILLTQLIFLKY